MAIDSEYGYEYRAFLKESLKSTFTARTVKPYKTCNGLMHCMLNYIYPGAISIY